MFVFVVACKRIATHTLTYMYYTITLLQNFNNSSTTSTHTWSTELNVGGNAQLPDRNTQYIHTNTARESTSSICSVAFILW